MFFFQRSNLALPSPAWPSSRSAFIYRVHAAWMFHLQWRDDGIDLFFFHAPILPNTRWLHANTHFFLAKSPRHFLPMRPRLSSYIRTIISLQIQLHPHNPSNWAPRPNVHNTSPPYLLYLPPPQMPNSYLPPPLLPSLYEFEPNLYGLSPFNILSSYHEPRPLKGPTTSPQLSSLQSKTTSPTIPNVALPSLTPSACWKRTTAGGVRDCGLCELAMASAPLREEWMEARGRGRSRPRVRWRVRSVEGMW